MGQWDPIANTLVEFVLPDTMPLYLSNLASADYHVAHAGIIFLSTDSFSYPTAILDARTDPSNPVVKLQNFWFGGTMCWAFEKHVTSSGAISCFTKSGARWAYCEVDPNAYPGSPARLNCEYIGVYSGYRRDFTSESDGATDFYYQATPDVNHILRYSKPPGMTAAAQSVKNLDLFLTRQQNENLVENYELLGARTFENEKGNFLLARDRNVLTVLDMTTQTQQHLGLGYCGSVNGMSYGDISVYNEDLTFQLGGRIYWARYLNDKRILWNEIGREDRDNG